MLITCFQCRQQLDVPEDSAGKRVRCPHCQYVIVVPSRARPVEAQGIETPALALPSMDLDGDGPAPTTKVAAQPLPPYEPPPAPKSAPPIEELPPTPSIDRNRRRRRPMAPLPKEGGASWRKILGIGAGMGVIAIVISVVIALNSSGNRNRGPQVVFQNPPPVMPMPMPKQIQPFDPRFNQGQGFAPGQNLLNQQGVPADAWRNIEDRQHRFKVQFPGQPLQNMQNINQADMAVFEVQPFNWSFTIAHAMLTEQQFQAIPLVNRFRTLKQNLRDMNGAFRQQNEIDVKLPGDHPGKEWQLVLPDNRKLFVRTYFVRSGANYHHYLLMVKAPFNVHRNHMDADRFFNSFSVMVEDGSGQTIIEELDAPQNGDRRDNEFTAMALASDPRVILTGTVASQIRVTSVDNKEFPEFTVPGGKPIEQVTISADDRWAALSVGGEIQYFDKRLEGKTVLPGLRAAFTKENHLLVATKDDIKEFQIEPHQLLSTLAVPDVAVKGFSLSTDERTLAVYGAKAILLYDWKDKKLLGRINAHAAAITAVAFAPDGRTLASASADRSVKLWNVETRAERATLNQHAWTVAALAFTPDGKHLASGGLDGMLLVWNLVPDQPQLVWAQAHQFPVRAVAFGRDGKNLYLTCKQPAAGKQYARQVRKIPWAGIKHNPQEAERVVAQRAGLHLPVISAMSYLSPDGQTFVTTTDGIDNPNQQQASLRLWDTATATLKHTHPIQNVGVLSPDGKWFAYAKLGAVNQMQLLDVPANRVADSVLTYPGPNFPFLMFTADGKSVWVLRNHEFVQYEIQQLPNGSPKLVQKGRVEMKNPNDPLRTATVYPAMDHKTFVIERGVINSMVRTRTLYASEDGKEMPRLMPGTWSSHLRLRRVPGTKLELYDFVQGTSKEIGQQRLPILMNLNINVSALDAAQKYAATTQLANDQTVRIHLWDLQERRPLLTWPDLNAREAKAVRFSSDGRYLALVTGDSWTRIVPTEWLLARKAFLPAHPNDVAAP